MTKKFYDRPYGAFSFQTATTVVCPNCKNAGTVHYDRKKIWQHFYVIPVI